MSTEQTMSSSTAAAASPEATQQLVKPLVKPLADPATRQRNQPSQRAISTERRQIQDAQTPSTGSRNPDDAWIVAEPYPMGRAGRRSLRGLIVCICPPAPAPAVEPMLDRLELQVRQLLRYMPPLIAWLLRASFVLLDHSPRLLFFSHRRLSGLPRADSEKLLHRLDHHMLASVRDLTFAVRGIILSTYFDQDEVHDAVGYAPGTFLQNRVALRARLLAGEAHTEADLIGATGIL